ncbi:unnamed protein product [Protopolystoma xenopodis]|uniref:Uncharacterized protein n=1 Tax=Protopolystoma xenopodis TaxID=117903 RepID=A0A3S4ZW66_9PLAT|nr:unnamed protein product [Protopolystoma xenopodis]
MYTSLYRLKMANEEELGEIDLLKPDNSSNRLNSRATQLFSPLTILHTYQPQWTTSNSIPCPSPTLGGRTPFFDIYDIPIPGPHRCNRAGSLRLTKPGGSASQPWPRGQNTRLVDSELGGFDGALNPGSLHHRRLYGS